MPAGSYPAAIRLLNPYLSASLSKIRLYLNCCCCNAAGPVIKAVGLFEIIANAIADTITREDARLVSLPLRTFLAKCR